MARPKSEDKRAAILSAATQIIAAQGLSASTASIAREAGVSNGSLFTYFDTKAALLNALFVALKQEMAGAATEGLPEADLQQQCLVAWSRWLQWSASFPEKRQALAHLNVSHDITPKSRQIGQQVMRPLAGLFERARKTGAMGNAGEELAAALMSAMADATVDHMIRDPKNAKAHSKAAFDALWRMIR